MKRFFRKHWILLLLAAISIIVHLFLVNPAWELHRDELLYLAEGDHLAWGYLEVPPTLAVLAFFIKMFGDAVWMVRVVPALFGALTLFFTGKITMELGGGRFAQLLACMAYLCSGYLRLNLLFQPNSPNVFYFTLGVYCLVRYIHTSGSKYLIYTGIIVGLGMMNKYSMILFVFGLLIGFVLTPLRKAFKNKIFYLGALIAMFLFLPNFIWQAVHHFPVVNHMQELTAGQLKYNSATGFIMGQLINCLPCLFVWIAGLIYFLFTPKGKPYRLFAWMYLSIILLLMILQGKDYYALGAYPVLLAGGGVWLEQLTNRRSLRTFLRPVCLLVPIIITIVIFPLLIPIYAPPQMAAYCARYKSLGLTRWEDGKEHALPQDYADMLGWKKMAELAARGYASLNTTEKSQTIIFCDNYGQGGAVDYYGRKYHLPAVQCKEASYILWNPSFKKFRNIILVSDNPDDLHDPLLTKNFQSIELLGRVDNAFAREKGTIVLLCKGATPQVVQFVNERNQRLKSRF